jgi:hypothetical protein
MLIKTLLFGGQLSINIIAFISVIECNVFLCSSFTAVLKVNYFFDGNSNAGHKLLLLVFKYMMMHAYLYCQKVYLALFLL